MYVKINCFGGKKYAVKKLIKDLKKLLTKMNFLTILSSLEKQNKFSLF